RVAFELSGCPGCKVYSLYPGQSSYNVANYQGSTKRRTFAGNFATLIGLGISANYQRQEDALKGSLVQSVYISGFQSNVEEENQNHESSEVDKAQEAADQKQNFSSLPIEQRFGWYYNSAPFDDYVTPGIRSTFAIITVPRVRIEDFKKALRNAKKDQNAFYPLDFTIKAGWTKRDK